MKGNAVRVSAYYAYSAQLYFWRELLQDNVSLVIVLNLHLRCLFFFICLYSSRTVKTWQTLNDMVLPEKHLYLGNTRFSCKSHSSACGHLWMEADLNANTREICWICGKYFSTCVSWGNQANPVTLFKVQNFLCIYCRRNSGKTRRFRCQCLLGITRLALGVLMPVSSTWLKAPPGWGNF